MKNTLERSSIRLIRNCMVCFNSLYRDMKKSILILVFTIIFFSLFAQNKVDTVYHFGIDSMICKVSESNSPNMVFTKVQVPPQYPGGKEAWENYISKKLKKPKGYDGVIEIWFIVELNGATTKTQIITPGGLTSKYQDYLINLITESGNWFPARQNGYCVRAWNRIKINE